MSAFAPELVISRGSCRVEVWVENGRVYPHPTGIVPKDVEDTCDNLRGERKKLPETASLIIPGLVNSIRF